MSDAALRSAARAAEAGDLEALRTAQRLWLRSHGEPAIGRLAGQVRASVVSGRASPLPIGTEVRSVAWIRAARAYELVVRVPGALDWVIVLARNPTRPPAVTWPWSAR